MMRPATVKATLRAVLLLLTAATAGCQARTQSGSGGSGGSSGGSIAFFDPGLNMQSSTLSFPAGWQAQGRVDRSMPCAQGTPFPQFRLQNQSQQMYILHMLPFFTYSNQGLLGNMDIHTCGVVSPLTHAADILQRYLVPQLTHSLQNAQLGRPEQMPGHGPRQGNAGGFRTTEETARVHVSYTENGQPREEWIGAITTITYFPGNNAGGTTTTQINIISAPQGKLDAALDVADNRLDMKVNPQWQQINSNQDQQQVAAITAHGKSTQAGINAQAQANMQQSVNMSNQTVDNIHRTGQISMQNAHDKQQAIDDSAQGTADYVGDKTRYWNWRNTVTGATTTTSTRQSPGTNWVPN